VAQALTRSSAAAWLDRMAGLRVVVVGDLFLDEYLVGRAERLSREGPVPVLAFTRRFCRPGGAANPARNIAALRAVALQVGVAGDDAAAAELRQALSDGAIHLCGVVEDRSRPTTVKTRIVAEGLAFGQQVARIDRQVREPVTGAVEETVLAALERCAAGADAILVSHYRSGVVTPAVCAAARARAVGNDLLLASDAQGDLERFAGFHLVRVGRGDAAAGLRRALTTEADFEAAASELRRELAARVVVLGRGKAGMSVADESGYAVVPPANVSEVFDVSGAGDTVIAVMTLALAAGAPVREAVELANFAAGIVVRRLGVVAPAPAEILAELDAS